MTHMDTKRKALLQGDLAERWNSHKRTIKRWRNARKIPQPDFYLPNGWPAWWEETIEAHERASVKRASSSTVEESATA
jgi:hypothetical protein